MPKFILSFSFSLFIATVYIVVPDVVQAREPAKAIDRLTAPHDNIEPTAPGSHTYQLVMSKDDKLCRHMLKLFNNDLAKYGYEQYRQHEEFNKIPWQAARFSFLDSGRIDYRDAQGAIFDFNNNGIQDFVVKVESMLSDDRVDYLYLLDRDASKRANELTAIELRDNKNKISLYGWTYHLKPPFQDVVAEYRVLEPFIFELKSYVYMRPLFKVVSGVNYAVIASYKGGTLVQRDLTGVIDDICYFKRIRTDKRL